MYGSERLNTRFSSISNAFGLMEGPDYLPRARAFTEYAPRPNHELTHLYNGSHNSMSHYQGTTGVSYMTANVQYSPVATTYSSYSPTYHSSSNHAQSLMYLPNTPGSSMGYHVRPPPRSVTLPSQHRILSPTSYCPSTSHSQHLQLRHPLSSDFSIHETEEQSSENSETMRSEAIEPPLQGYPNVDDFENLMKRYVEQLSPKKQDKALIHAKRAANIRTVLLDKKTTSVESAQFRFWVKKMFQLQPSDPSVSPNRRKICHEGKPVAVREKLFKILTRAHQKCQHGGRDKTSAQVRRVYSWVPKELISRFVKICPTCQIRRGMNRGSPPEDGKSPPDMADPPSPETSSPTKARRDSVMSPQDSMDMPMQLVNGSSAFQSQNRWLSDFQPQTSAYDSLCSTGPSNAPATAFPTINGLNAIDQSAHHPRSSLSYLHNGQSGGSRPVSNHGSRFKQETQYRYD